MHVDVIEEFAALEGARGDWEAAYAADPEASLFMSWRWIADWLAASRTVWLVLAAKPTQADDRYVAFLPLRMRVHFDKERGFFNELYLAGGEFSDHAGVLAHPDFEAAAISAFTDHLRKKLNWAKLTLHNLWMSERRRRLFLSAFDELRFVHKDIEYFDKVGNTNLSVCPSAALPSDWDTYLTNLSANNRQKIRRWQRKVEASEEYDITLSEPETYARDIDMLLDLWKTKWTRRKGSRAEKIAQCNRAMLNRCARNGTLFLPVFRHGGRPVAALAILVDPVKKAMLFLITGRDESYEEAPAGYLLHAYSIRHAIAQGFATYDFLRGDEPYKYLFASQEQRLRACSVATRNGRNLGDALDPRGLERMRDKVLELEKKNEIAAAVRAYRQILEMQPDDALTLYRLGRLQAKRNDHTEAVALFSRSVEVEPGGSNAWLKLALSLHALGDDAGALKACREVVRLQPKSEEANRLILQLTLSAQRAPTNSRLWPDQGASVLLGGQGGRTPDWMRLGPAGWSVRPGVAVAPERP
jgi:CelD/BcsL family acetyltransferase involved in cellulose biosynthesis